MHNSESVQKYETCKLLRGFEVETDHLILARRLGLVKVNKKMRTCRIVDFGVSANHRVKLKESEKKKDNYFDLAKELKNVWSMMVRIIIGALRTFTKGLIQGQKDLEIRGRVKTIQTKAIRSPEY